MIDSFISYIERLELLTFFSGYPIVYAFVQVLALGKSKKGSLMNGLVAHLTMAYALVGTFFVMLWLRQIYIHLGIKNLESGLNITPLRTWGLISIFFWFPIFRTKPVYALLHSSVFFLLFCKDVVAALRAEMGNDILANDMKVYTVSIVLNLISLILLSLISFLINNNTRR